MSLHNRLNRLETAFGRADEPRRKTFDQAFEEILALHSWLAAKGYPDALAAVEAGDTGPEGLGDLLREQAGYDTKHRAWARIEQALAAGELPDDADLRLLKSQQE